MIGVIFLLVLAVIWIVFASVSDVKTTEIFNWLSFSLIIFALGFRFFYSLFVAGNFSFFYQGLIGLGIFFVLGNLLYYLHVFAGGDTKLMISLGTILPFSNYFFVNLKLFVTFIFLFLFAGAIYGIAMSTYFAIKNSKKFRKEFSKVFRLHFIIYVFSFLAGLSVFLIGIFTQQTIILILGILLFLMPLLYVYTKAVDESCMIKEVKPEKLMEGDWLYKDVKVKGKTFKAGWGGLTEENIKFLRKSSKPIAIRRGIAFAPVFLISFILLACLFFLSNNLFTVLWNSFG